MKLRTRKKRLSREQKEYRTRQKRLWDRHDYLALMRWVNGLWGYAFKQVGIGPLGLRADDYLYLNTSPEEIPKILREIDLAGRTFTCVAWPGLPET